MNAFFKSVIDQDRAPVVICDLNHVIVYMNPVAEKNYEKWGGAEFYAGQSYCGVPEKEDCIEQAKRLGFKQLGTIPGGFRMKDGYFENICPYHKELV